MEKIKRFSELFSGLPRAHGKYTEDRNLTKASGKVGGRAQTIEGEMTPEKWEAHLTGKYGVGVVPILDDGTCNFAAIDFDQYNELTVQRFVNDAKKSGVPLVWCKSKSGGAHLYVFFTEPANAAAVRAKLSELARMLGYPKIEIFPKQEQLDATNGEVGNWINLPYFDAEMTQRYAFDDAGKPVADLEKFLDYAESKRISPDAFNNVKIQQQEIPFSDAPPCIQTMAHNGIGDGERNKAMFQFGVYAKKKHPDEWQDRLLEWNAEFVNPPLPFKEIQATIFKSLDTDKEYGYLCKEPVCAEVCNKPLCQTREFGVMGGMIADWDDWTIEGIRKVVQVNADGGVVLDDKETEPYYIMAINGRDVTFTLDQLFSNQLFRKKVFSALDKMPPRMNNAMWDQMVQHWLLNHEVLEIPFELTGAANLGSMLKSYIDVAPDAHSRRDLLHGMVLYEDGKFLFHFESFARFLQQRRYPTTTPTVLWKQLRNLGIDKKSTTTSGNKKLNYWVVSERFIKTDPSDDGQRRTTERLEF
jgi:hypothetical protein